MLAVAVLIGLIAGLAFGGSPAGLGRPGFRALWLPFLGVALELTYGALDRFFPQWFDYQSWYWVIVCGYTLCILLFCWRNRRYAAGALFAAAGTLANFAVIAANSWRMPVSGAVLAAYGASPQPSLGYFVEQGDAALGFLGDIIPFVPPYGGLLSVGDLLLCAGVVFWIMETMRMGAVQGEGVLRHAGRAKCLKHVTRS
ncbi:MAG: DUF5317 family protein [Eubacteriales bacterium]|nr:DUF5317 family protein [Eubacteriales bacterium]